METLTMNSTLTATPPVEIVQTIVASYRSHADAEDAIRHLASGGVPIDTISIIGRNFETREDIQGFYRPADAALSGAGQGAWLGGLFGLMMGAFGLFVLPIVGAVMVLGPVSGMIAGAIGGAGAGALISGLIAAGIPRDQAFKYQERLQAGEFLVIVHGPESVGKQAHEMLEGTPQTYLRAHSSKP
jgi:hypothetical protein